MTLADSRISPVLAVSIACLAMAVALIGLVVAINAITGMPIEDLVSDPAATMDVPAYIGLLSNATVLLWAAAATLSLFSAALLPDGHPVRGFLALFGTITLVFALDDVYMFHEYIAPDLLGIPQKVVYLFYGLAIMALFSRSRPLSGNPEYPLFIIALAGLALSAGIDILDSRDWFPVEDPYLLEEGFKIAGVLFWLAYVAMLARTALRE
jgi:hypothetical protein